MSEREPSGQEDAVPGEAGPEFHPSTDIVSSTLARLRAAGVSRETLQGEGKAQPGTTQAGKTQAGRNQGGRNQGRNSSGAGRSTNQGDQRSGPAPDERDPQRISRSVDRLMREMGWQQSAAVGSMLTRWSEIVGPEVGDHCVPESFDEESHKLVLRAESTAWKTQLQMMLPLIRQRIDGVVGRGVVADISIVGPAPPKRYRGPGRISGRGPRDTWG